MASDPHEDFPWVLHGRFLQSANAAVSVAQAVINEDTRGDEASLWAEIQRLKDELAAYQSGSGQPPTGQQPHAASTPARGSPDPPGGVFNPQATAPFTPAVRSLHTHIPPSKLMKEQRRSCSSNAAQPVLATPGRASIVSHLPRTSCPTDAHQTLYSNTLHGPHHAGVSA